MSSRAGRHTLSNSRSRSTPTALALSAFPLRALGLFAPFLLLGLGYRHVSPYCECVSFYSANPRETTCQQGIRAPTKHLIPGKLCPVAATRPPLRSGQQTPDRHRHRRTASRRSAERTTHRTPGTTSHLSQECHRHRIQARVLLDPCDRSLQLSDPHG